MHRTAKDTKIFTPANRKEWREWLEQNHSDESAVWLIYHKKSSQLTTITWSEAVDEALCFGWIDSIAKPLDADRYMQFFSKRKPGGGWSKINKEKIRKLTEEGRMCQAGLDAIAAAKQNGSWALLDKIEELIVPDDLAGALASNAVAEAFFQKLSKSDKRHLLYWVSSAKRDDTRRKRIEEIVEFTGQNLKPKILTWTKKVDGG
ncbi:YdeI family protein [Dyadobacter sp. SG02]|uniref:YdeI/OmpD-associated family protein n=1 Tax=Dyadobacter sp. SG02 TaxID=1855291 RepID=UPI0015A6488A|nr:YdeI/OmpD-associated family protein [Dyadobacter sp. SG02]